MASQKKEAQLETQRQAGKSTEPTPKDGMIQEWREASKKKTPKTKRA